MERDHYSFSDLFSVCLRTFDHLNCIQQILRMKFPKFRILEILNFHLCVSESS